MLTQPTATFNVTIKPGSTRLLTQQKHNPPPPTPYSTKTTSQSRCRRMMAKNTSKVVGSSWHWTNERHVHFLNSMEASFVQSMFENKGRFPPLDRYLPDISESTDDLGKDRRRRHSTSDIVESSERTEKKIRILSSQKSSQDQVVPQFKKQEG